MIEAYLRPIYQYYLVNPIARIIRHFSPWKITLAACLIGCTVPFALLFHSAKIATFLLLFSGFLDTLDGTVARIEHKTSAVGSILDIISDRIVEFAVIFGLFALDPGQRTLMSLLMLGSCYLCVTSFLAIGIFTSNQSNKGFHYSTGLIERAEAFIFFILMIWLPKDFNMLAGLFSLLALLTAYLHIRQFIKTAKVP